MNYKVGDEVKIVKQGLQFFGIGAVGVIVDIDFSEDRLEHCSSEAYWITVSSGGVIQTVIPDEIEKVEE